jgi:hypothetical protein
MLVQTDLGIEGCSIGEIVGTVMVFHMDMYQRLMKGLLNVYFLYSVFEPTNMSLFIKSRKFHFRYSSDLYRTSDPGYISYPELHYTQRVKVTGAACKMMCRVAVSQPHTNRFHVHMLPSVWRSIKFILLEETKKNNLDMYHNHDFAVPTVKRGFFVTPGNIILLATVDLQTEPRYKVERMIAYTREHIIVLQSYFCISLEICARVRYPKSKSEQERVVRKNAKTITTSLAAGLSDGEGLARPRTPLTIIPVLSPVKKIVTAPVTIDVRINTLTQLPEESKVDDVHHSLEGVTLLYDWASHQLTLQVG